MKIVKDGTGSKYRLGRPCFGFFLQGAVKSLAITDVGIQLGSIFYLTTALLASYVVRGWNVKEFDSSNDIYVTALSSGYCYLYHILSMVYSKTLYLYANKRDKSGLQKWLFISATALILYIIFFLIYMTWIEWAYLSGAAISAIYIIYKLYFFWVLLCYILEIKYYAGFNSALKELSDSDIEGFFHGNSQSQNEYEGCVENMKGKPYRFDLEIPFSRIKMNDGIRLGYGAFGTVLKAQLRLDDGDPFTEARCFSTVAVKTLSEGARICYFKALLSELKILCYIGRHENVVNLIGACTSLLKERKIYIVVEFCQLGCISDYLRANRGTFLPCYDVHRVSTPLNSACQPPSVLDLVKWSLQTASGMEYISNKKIVHGDLAGRNVLLTGDRMAKVADFGLSRQLYHYSTYIKQNEEPLPWQWLSPESLSDLHFSTPSDVWSFGVTLWEYFTLGETPNSNYTCNADYIRKLRLGQIRLHKPPYISEELFVLLNNCWTTDPNLRPTFKNIKIQLEQILQKCSAPPDVSTVLSGYICF